MQVVFRKLYISILASVMILLTSIATTFAWVGMLTTSSLGSFDINLKVEDLDNEYFLTISSTGRSDDFSDHIPLKDIQNQIMDNMGIDCSGIIRDNDAAVNNHFGRNAVMTPVTTDKNLTYFKEMEDITAKKTNLIDSKKYYQFDVYLSVGTNLAVDNDTKINANVFFENIENALSGVVCSGHLVGENPFKDKIFSSPYTILPTLPRYGMKINSEYAARLAFKIYEPIRIESSYNENSPVKRIVIYQKGTKYPTYNNDTGLYCFGGILPEEYNLAIKEIEKLYGFNLDITNDAQERIEFDKFMTKDNYHVWESPADNDVNDTSGTNYLGIYKNVKTKLKISVYFWFEGWDADCLNFIDKQKVDLGISFSTDTKKND